MNDEKPHLSTYCAHAGAADLPSQNAPAVMPIYQTSVYEFGDLEELDAVWEGKKPGFIYGRYALPNHAALENIVAKLEQGEGAIASASGMASIVVALWALLQSGDEVVVANDSYGGTLSLAARDFPRFGITNRFFSTTKMAGIEAAFLSRKKVFVFETLSYPLGEGIDFSGVWQIFLRKGVQVLVGQ